MMEADSERIRPEMLKDYVWLQTSDDSVQEVEQEVAKFCPFISSKITSGMGSSKNNPIPLPPLVNSQILSPILNYCRFHHLPGHSTKDIKHFNQNFVQKDITTLLELSYAANSLQLDRLVNLTNCAAARMIEGNSPEADDLTEEEKLEPIINTMGDPKIRLLNRLNAKKRKELEERQIIKNIEVEEDHSDDRPVDDLIAFINGGNEGMQDGLIYMKHYRASHGDRKGATNSKRKKKNRKRKDNDKTAPSGCMSTSYSTKKESYYVGNSSPTAHANLLPEDELDPARLEEIDREVEDFRRRLKRQWSKVKRDDR